MSQLNFHGPCLGNIAAKNLRNSNMFTTNLRDEIRSGRCLVPFIGSGFSAASGIIMGMEFDHLLSWAVYRSVSKENAPKRLVIEHSGWPEAPLPEDMELVQRWIRKVQDIELKRQEERARIAVGVGDSKELPTDQLTQLLSVLRTPQTPGINRTSISVAADAARRDFWSTMGLDRMWQSYAPDPGCSPTSQEFLEAAAIRSLCDWRSTINFLARLRVNEHGQPWLSEQPSQHIIDSFNQHIVRGRKPNMGHNMLCHLSLPGRIRVILTTNFDRLIEEAFADLKKTLTVHPVSIYGALPDPATVHAQNCVIKLHGEQAETRADFSLNLSPSQKDKSRFFEIVCGRAPDGAQNGFLPSHLLVIGFSGTDMRCIELMKHVLDMSQETNIYWVCYSESDYTRLEQTFWEPSYRHRIIPLVTDRSDLLLYELYQKIELSLPPGGFNYQFNANFPPHTALLEEQDLGVPIDKIKHQLGLRSDSYDTPAPYKDPLVIDGDRGTTALMYKAFTTIQKDNYVSGLWLELDDYNDVPGLAHDILQIIALRIGRYQLEHVELAPTFPAKNLQAWIESWIEHATTVLSRWQVSTAKWLLVFHSRNGAGGCHGWTRRYWQVFDVTTKERELDNAYAFFRALALAGFRVIYLPYTARRYERDFGKEPNPTETTGEPLKFSALLKRDEDSHVAFVEKMAESLGVENFPETLYPEVRHEWFDMAQKPEKIDPSKLSGKNHLTIEAKDSPSGVKGFDTIIYEIYWKWIEKHEGDKRDPLWAERRRFLYASTLFRQSRHYSALISEAVMLCPYRGNRIGIDNDWVRHRRLEDWRKELVESQVFHAKPGDFMWMHREQRLGIRRLLECAGPTEIPGGTKETHPSLIEVQARTHLHIASWQLRTYFATGHGIPYLESLYHFGQAAIHASFARKAKTDAERILPKDQAKKQKRKELEWRRRLFEKALFGLIKTLKLSQFVMQFWMEKLPARTWFGLPEADFLETKEEVKFATRLTSVPFFDALEQTVKNLQSSIHDPWGEEAAKLLKGLRTSFKQVSLIRENEFVSGDLNSRHYPAFPDRFAHARNPEMAQDAWNQAIKGGMKPLANNKGFEAIFEARFAFDAWTRAALQPERRPKSVSFIEDTRCEEKLAKVADMMVAFIRRARLIERSSGSPLPLEAPENVSETWAKTSAVCRLVDRLSVDVHPDLYASEIRERVRAQADYGLCLAHLNRFFEANRRITDAAALLSKTEAGREPLMLSMIEMRRAEARLLEARFIRNLAGVILTGKLRCGNSRPRQNRQKWSNTPTLKLGIIRSEAGKLYACFADKDMRVEAFKSWLEIYLDKKCWAMGDSQDPSPRELHNPIAPLQQIFAAKLDEACLCLENAERYLAGNTHASEGWFRLRYLQLRLIAEHPYYYGDDAFLKPEDRRTLAFRVKRDMIRWTKDVFISGTATCPIDEYKKLVLVHYAIDAIYSAVANAEPKGAKEAAKAHVQEAFIEVAHLMRPLATYIADPDLTNKNLLRNYGHHVSQRYQRRFLSSSRKPSPLDDLMCKGNPVPLLKAKEKSRRPNS